MVVAKHEDQFESLLATVEGLRAEHFDGMPAEIVKAILLLHKDGTGLTSSGLNDIDLLVNNYLDAEGEDA